MNVYYNVRPKYSAGSPAMVDRRTAQRVADDEVTFHARTMEGYYGEARQVAAVGDTMRGAAEEVREYADCWWIHDLITGETYLRPFVKDRETDKAKEARYYRLRHKYRLPLESELPTTADGLREKAAR